MLLFIDRYTQVPTEPGNLHKYINLSITSVTWMNCAFNVQENLVMKNTAK